MGEDNYSLGSRVFHMIRENILSGKYERDEELKEKSIGEELGVSRTPVREALRQLELEGLVTIIPNKGAYVVGISQKDIKDIYEIRSRLEGLCAKWAAENITKEQADIIGEVANICTGTAATALSMIINRSTNITTPLVEVLDKENTLESDNHILVKVPYTSGLDGTNLMVLDVQDALVIASLMMGGDGRNLSNLQLDDLTLSAIAEAMNQMCGSIATSMASLLSRPTDIGFPLINSKDRKTFEIPDELCNGTDIVKVTFRLTVEDLIDSELIQLYPISIVKQILKQEDI